MDKIIVFDLDGTIVDTAPDLVASLNHALVSHGLPATPFDAMRRYAGHGGRAMIERVHASLRRPLAEETRDAMIGVFLAHYRKAIPGVSAPYPGALPLFERFRGAGYRLAVCTNKPQALADSLLGALGLAPLFDAVCGADAFAFRKPDPRHLTETIALAGGDRDRAVMVGDSNTDIATAKAAGIPVIAVEFGYSDAPVISFEPSATVAHLDDITLDMAERLIAAVQG